jgi:hypothetical protein
MDLWVEGKSLTIKSHLFKKNYCVKIILILLIIVYVQ